MKTLEYQSYGTLIIENINLFRPTVHIISLNACQMIKLLLFILVITLVNWCVFVCYFVKNNRISRLVAEIF